MAASRRKQGKEAKKNGKGVEGRVLTGSTAKSSTVHLIIRFVLLLVYASHFWYSFKMITDCPNKEKVFKSFHGFGGRWKFLTSINEALVSIYLLMTFIIDLLPVHQIKTHFRPFSDLIFTSLAWPVTLIVSIFFWSIYLYNRELIFPTLLDECVPLIVNHGFHTLPLIAVVMETVFISHKYPSNITASLTMLAACTGYTIWILIIYNQTNRWVYPFMKTFTPVTFVLFNGASAIVGMGFYFIGKALGQLVWNERSKMCSEVEKTKKS